MSQVIAKRCRLCGTDVANQKRTKDTAGNYYCQPCYDAAQQTAGDTLQQPQLDALEALATAAGNVGHAEVELFDCPQCDGKFSYSNMHASGVCTACAATQRHRFPTARKVAPAKHGVQVSLPLIGSIGLAALLIGGLVTWLLVRENDGAGGQRPAASSVSHQASPGASDADRRERDNLHDPDETNIRESLLFYAKRTRDFDQSKTAIDNCRAKQREAQGRGDVSGETRWLQEEQRHLAAQHSAFMTRATVVAQLKAKGSQRVEKVKARLLADTATPEEYRLILSDFSTPDGTTTPQPSLSSSQSNSSESAEELFKRGLATANDADALGIFRKAADLGSFNAMNNIGAFYGEGRGVGRDDVQAIVWYRKAADGGNAMAMSNLAQAYLTGSGVGEDRNTAMEWLRRAAKAGHPTATDQYNQLLIIEQVAELSGVLQDYGIAVDAVDELDRQFDAAAARGDRARAERLSQQHSKRADDVTRLGRRAKELTDNLMQFDHKKVREAVGIILKSEGFHPVGKKLLRSFDEDLAQ